MKGKGSKSGRHRKDNAVINFTLWEFKNLNLDEEMYSYEVWAPKDLFRYFKNEGRKFYLQGKYTLDDIDEDDEDASSRARYLYPQTVKMVNPDGFHVRLYEVEKRYALKIIYDLLNANHMLGSLV